MLLRRIRDDDLLEVNSTIIYLLNGADMFDRPAGRPAGRSCEACYEHTYTNGTAYIAYHRVQFYARVGRNNGTTPRRVRCSEKFKIYT